MVKTQNFDNISHEYKELVEKASKNNEDFFIENSTIDHARFLTYTLIKRAKKSIKIFTGELFSKFYDDELIFKSLEEKLKEGVKIKIVCQKKPQSKKCLDLEATNPNLKIRVLNNHTLLSHFLLSDSSSFRMETPHTLGKIDKLVGGKANFNNRNFGELLEVFFKEIFDRSTSTK